MVLPTIPNPYISGVIIAMGGVDMGLALAYTGPTLTAITEEFDLSKIESTMFNVSAYIAAMVGAIVINFFVKKYGKRNCSFAVGIIALVSWVCLSQSSNKAMAFVFRCLTGSTIGLYSTISPVYIMDVAPQDKKGLFGFMNQLGLALGFLLINIFGAVTSWKWLALICAFPGLVQVCSVLFVPDPIQTVLKTSFTQIFKFPKQLIIALLLMFFLQFSGVNAVLSNLSIIINNANLNVSTSLVSIMATVAQLIATLISSLLVDKLGQRVCWTLSSAGQMIAFLLLFAHQKFVLPSIVFMVGLFLEQLTYGIGTGPVPFTKTAELFKIEVRSTAMAIATAFQWFVGGVVCYLWPTLQDLMGIAWSFFFFAIISLISIIFGILVLVPQTNAGYGENEDSDNETEEISRRLSHAMDIPEL